MDLIRIFGMPAALIILAVLANRLSRVTRVPDIIVLLLIGVGLGPILGWVNPSYFGTAVRVLGMLALVLILFEGGLELRLREALRNLPGGLLLAIVSFGLSVVAVAEVARLLLHMSWSDGLLVGATLGASSGAVILPALQQIDAPEPVKVTLTLEASLGEIIAVLTVGTLLTIGGNEPLLTGLVAGFSKHVLADVLVGAAAGVAWSKVWPVFAGQPFANILNLGVVLAVFVLGRYAGGSGLLAELVFGITLANMPRTPHQTRIGARMLAFHSEFTFLVRSFFFVLLGIMAQFVSRRRVVPIVAILLVLMLARFVAVMSTRWAIRDSTPRDAELLFFMLPRGLITAVLALEVVSAKGDDFHFLPAMAFTAVLVTNLFVVAAAFRSRRTLPILAVASGSAIPELRETPFVLEPLQRTVSPPGATSGTLV